MRVTGVSRTTVAGRVERKSLDGIAVAVPVAAETGAKEAVEGAQTRCDVDLCGPKTAQGLALADRRVRHSMHLGLGYGSA